DDFVEHCYFFGSAFKQIVGESPGVLGGLRGAPEFGFELRGILRTDVPLKEHLHRVLAAFGAQSHVTCAASFRRRQWAWSRAAFATAGPFRSLLGRLQSLCFRL